MRDSQAAAEANALATRYLEAYEGRFPETDREKLDGLFDNSLAAYESWEAREARFLAELNRIAPALQNGSAEGTTLALLRERLEMSQQYRSCRRELWNVGPLTGWLNEYRAYAAQQPVGTAAARQAALRRWRKLPTFIDTEIANLRIGVRQGYTAPVVLVRGAIGQADGMLALPVAQSPFYAPAARDTVATFRAAFERIVRDSVTPALRRYRDYLANEYSAGARQTVGLNAMPNGAECFRALIRRYTTLDIAPAELESRGRTLIAGADYATTREYIARAIADPANRFADSREALGAMSEALKRVAGAAHLWFGRLPDRIVPLVDSMPDGGASDPDAMYVPANGSEPPRIYVNVPRLLEPGGRLYADRLAFHEGTPGHHMQVALQRSANVHPLNRVLWNTAFGEGWAVYASNLALDMGLYSSDVASIAFKSRVDDGLTFIVQHGLHTLGWSRQQAIDTLLKYSAAPAAEAAQQVDYFIAAPAHALAYPLGARYIEDLRRETARKHGNFDVRAFHDVVLQGGALPLGVLTQTVNQWVERTQPRPEPAGMDPTAAGWRVLQRAVAAHRASRLDSVALVMRWTGVHTAPLQNVDPDFTRNPLPRIVSVAVDMRNNATMLEDSLVRAGVYTGRHRYTVRGEQGTDLNLNSLQYRPTNVRAARRLVREIVPALLLRETLRQTSPRLTAADDRYDVVQVSLRDGFIQTLTFERLTGLLARIETEVTLPILGFSTWRIEFSDYRVVDGIPIAHQRRTELSGYLSESLTVASVRTAAQAPAGLFDLPAGAVARDDRVVREQAGTRIQSLGEGVLSIAGIAGTDLTVLAIDLGNEGLMVAGTPDGITDSVVAVVRERFPGRELRYAVPTHHHSDHAGGVAGYLRAGTSLHNGVSIVATPGNEGWLQQLALRTIHRHRSLERVAAGGSRTFGGGRVVVYDIGPTPHAREMLIVYIPALKLIYQGDLLELDDDDPITERTANEVTPFLLRAIERLGLEVETIVGTEGRPGTLADLRRATELRRR